MLNDYCVSKKILLREVRKDKNNNLMLYGLRKTDSVYHAVVVYNQFQFKYLL